MRCLHIWDLRKFLRYCWQELWAYPHPLLYMHLPQKSSLQTYRPRRKPHRQIWHRSRPIWHPWRARSRSLRAIWQSWMRSIQSLPTACPSLESRQQRKRTSWKLFRHSLKRPRPHPTSSTRIWRSVLFTCMRMAVHLCWSCFYPLRIWRSFWTVPRIYCTDFPVWPWYAGQI